MPTNTANSSGKKTKGKSEPAVFTLEQVDVIVQKTLRNAEKLKNVQLPDK